MIRRSKDEVIVDILRVATNGSTKTHIIYDTKLNYSVVQRYLEMLIEKELIRQENGRFITTAKGKNFQQLAMELKL